jgi:hypothetical protein
MVADFFDIHKISEFCFDITNFPCFPRPEAESGVVYKSQEYPCPELTIIICPTASK